MLVLTAGEVQLGANVEVRMTLPNDVELSAVGRVVRSAATTDPKKNALAVHCEERFSQILPKAYDASLA